MPTTPDGEIPLIDLEDLADVEEKKEARKSGKTAPKFAPWKAGAIASFTTQGYHAIANVCRTFGWNDWADVFDTIAEPAGPAWEKVAKRNEVVRRMFDRIMTTGDFSELLWAHFPLFVFAAGKGGLFNRVMTDGVGAEFTTALQEEMRREENDNVVNTARGRAA